MFKSLRKVKNVNDLQNIDPNHKRIFENAAEVTLFKATANTEIASSHALMTVNEFTKLAFSRCKSSFETEKMRSLIAPLIAEAKKTGDFATRDWSLTPVPALLEF